MLRDAVHVCVCVCLLWLRVVCRPLGEILDASGGFPSLAGGFLCDSCFTGDPFSSSCVSLPFGSLVLWVLLLCLWFLSVPVSCSNMSSPFYICLDTV